VFRFFQERVFKAIAQTASKRSAGCPRFAPAYLDFLLRSTRQGRVQFDNATNLDRKSGVPGTMMIGFHCFPRRAQPHLLPRRHATKQWWGLRPVFFVPRTLGERGAPTVLSPNRLRGMRYNLTE
jgi:hypothetical protein